MRTVQNRKAYLEKAPTKQKREWTPEDRCRIYTLADKHLLSRSELIRVFKVKKPSVMDNQLRLARKIHRPSNKKRCYACTRPMTKDEIKRARKRGTDLLLCDVCKKTQVDAKQETREKALKKGLCGVCHTKPITKGRTTCEYCNSATYRRRIKEKLCGCCGLRPLAKRSKALCEVCLSEHAETTRTWRSRKKLK